MLIRTLIVCAICVFCFSTVQAAEAEETKTQTAARDSVKVANVVLVSAAYQAPLSLEKSIPLGIGVGYTREYFVSKRTAIGIHGAFRIFPEKPTQYALGYGLTIKHYIGHFQTDAQFGLYILYGLLAQMNFLSDRKGTAVGHDTRLAIGFDWQAQWSPVIEAGYHVTQVRNFETRTIRWGFTEIAAGIRF